MRYKMSTFFLRNTFVHVLVRRGGVWKNMSRLEILLKPISFSFSLQCDWWDSLERYWTVLTVIH